MGWRLHGLRREDGTGLGGTVLSRVLLNSLIRLCSRHRLGGRHRLCGLRAGGQLGTALLAEPYAGFRLLTAHRAHGTRLHGYGRPQFSQNLSPSTTFAPQREHRIISPHDYPAFNVTLHDSIPLQIYCDTDPK